MEFTRYFVVHFTNQLIDPWAAVGILLSEFPESEFEVQPRLDDTFVLWILYTLLDIFVFLSRQFAN
jgi:hypothetical protein